MHYQNEKIQKFLHNLSTAPNIQFGSHFVAVKIVQRAMAAIVFTAMLLLVLLKFPDIQPAGFVEINSEIGKIRSSRFVEIKSQVKQRAAYGRYFAHENRRAGMIDRKKMRFFEELIPYFMVAQQEVTQERDFVLTMQERLGEYWEKFYFIGSFPDQINTLLSSPEKRRLLILADKYRVASSKALLERINIVPMSLMLAQAALETSWGESRFAVLGNNYFGMWTWGSVGMIPKERDAGKNHRVAQYPNPLYSARSYLLTLNRLRAYEKLRQIRKYSMDSLKLAGGLLAYSERHQAYVDEVRMIISTNALQRYDL